MKTNQHHMLTIPKVRRLMEDLERQIQRTPNPRILKRLQESHLNLQRTLNRMKSRKRSELIKKRGQKATQRRKRSLLKSVR
jgi:hypothetical protein